MRLTESSGKWGCATVQAKYLPTSYLGGRLLTSREGKRGAFFVCYTAVTGGNGHESRVAGCFLNITAIKKGVHTIGLLGGHLSHVRLNRPSRQRETVLLLLLDFSRFERSWYGSFHTRADVDLSGNVLPSCQRSALPPLHHTHAHIWMLADAWGQAEARMSTFVPSISRGTQSLVRRRPELQAPFEERRVTMDAKKRERDRLRLEARVG